MSGCILKPADLAALIGSEIGVSRWVTMDQPRIAAFADVTEDRQFIHLDSGKAAQTPFGGTVAHGFLTLSMLSAMAYDTLPQIEGQKASVNYGFDRLRFIAPVRSGADVRARFQLEEVEPRKGGDLMLGLAVTMEIKGIEKPAVVAVWRILYMF